MGRPEDKSEQLEITEEQKAMRQRVELISLLQFLRQDHDGNTTLQLDEAGGVQLMPSR